MHYVLKRSVFPQTTLHAQIRKGFRRKSGDLFKSVSKTQTKYSALINIFRIIQSHSKNLDKGWNAALLIAKLKVSP